MAATKGVWDSLPKAEQEKLRREMAASAAKEPKDKPKQKAVFSLKGYIRCELSAADKDGFKSWEGEREGYEWLSHLVEWVDGGYLVKIGESGSGYQASLCAATTGRDWEGYVLTAHAATAMRAAMLLVYKHELLMDKDWSAWLTEEGEDFFR